MASAFAAAAAPAAADCPAPLPARVLRAGDARVSAFRRLEKGERAPDLMGFRAGPRLGPPSQRERRRIRDDRAARRQFGLNPSTLLIRRLIRDHSRRSRISFNIGIKVTTLEERELTRRVRFEDALHEVDRYSRRCAPGTTADVYIDNPRWPNRYRIVALFKGPLSAHRTALAKRYRYRDLLVVHAARYSTRELKAIQDRISADWDDWGRRGISISSVGIHVDERNAVVVDVEKRPTARVRRAFRDRYGPAVRLRMSTISW